VKVALGHQGALKATKIVVAATSYVSDARFFSHAAIGTVRLASTTTPRRSICCGSPRRSQTLAAG